MFFLKYYNFIYISSNSHNLVDKSCCLCQFKWLPSSREDFPGFRNECVNVVFEIDKMLKNLLDCLQLVQKRENCNKWFRDLWLMGSLSVSMLKEFYSYT